MTGLRLRPDCTCTEFKQGLDCVETGFWPDSNWIQTEVRQYSEYSDYSDSIQA
jgi:hypothetical protein